jgi:hypothetical protein
MSDVSIRSVSDRWARSTPRSVLRVSTALRSERAVMAGIVVAGALPRIVTALTSPTAVYFPDEYIYTQLARSIAHGHLAIRGAQAHFPALLEPLLAAPFWTTNDPLLAYRLTLVMHGIAMALAAIPVYLLARRIGATRWQRTLVAALTVVAPTMTWSTYVTADAIAYPLALGAIAAGVAALENPRKRTQLLFLALSGLATFARVQYVILPVAFIVAAFIVERGNPLRTARRYRFSLVLIAAPVLGGAALGLHRLLGYYGSLLAFHIDVIGMLHWMAIDSMLIAFATGFALAPGAVAGLCLSLRRGAARVDRAFASITLAFGALVMLETAAYATNGSARFQERYLVTLMALVPLAFLLGVRSLPRGKAIFFATSLGLFVFLVRVPMTGYSAVSGKQDSPFLSAVFYVERLAGIGTGGLIVAIVGGALLLGGGMIALRPTRASAALVLAGTVLAFASFGAAVDAHDGAANARATYFAGDLAWIDHARLGRVDMLLAPGTFPPSMLESLYWNSSLTDVLNLPGSNLVDDFGHRAATIAPDGRVLVGARAESRPVLVDGYYSSLTFQNAAQVARVPSAALWKPTGPIRVSTMTVGRYFDGWLDRTAVITIWPHRAGGDSGVLSFQLSFPVTKDVTAELRISTPGRSDRIVQVRRGHSVDIALPLTITRPVQVKLSAPQGFIYGQREVSVKSSIPHFTAAGERP